MNCPLIHPEGMTITLNVYYRGTGGSAARFAEKVASRGILDRVHAEDGNLMYGYHRSMSDPEVVLLVEKWRDAGALDAHKAAEPLALIRALASEHGLETTVETFQD